MDSDEEAYILLLLSDSNLPTGSFVASSGFESFEKHGFCSRPNSISDFVQDSLGTYARSVLPFVSDAYIITRDYLERRDVLENAIGHLKSIDTFYHVNTLNHVARRASKSQGVALLTLHSKGFTRPPSIPSCAFPEEREKEVKIDTLINQLKLAVRREDTHGHLSLCWGVLTAALGLTLERSQHLHLFLHARSLLSAAVRLNSLGPYAAQQILLHAVRPLVPVEVKRCGDLRTGILATAGNGFDPIAKGPATTWPLGEILAARHDLQHSRIFNS